MSKKISLLMIMLISLFTLASCKRGGETEEVKYTVSFDTQCEVVVEAVQVKSGESLIEEPNQPVREGYVFKGWYLGEKLWDFIDDKVTSDITLTAKWEEEPHEHVYVDGKCECGAIDPASIEYTITFDTDGGSSIESLALKADEAVTAPANPTKEGYTFKGWEPALPEVMPASNITVKAIWEANTYTIKFNTGEGSKVDTITLKYGEAVVAPEAPTREGYDFVGWSAELPKTMPAKNLTLTAKWEAQTKAIIYELNEGSLEGSYVDEFKVGIGATLPTPVKDGYEFKGWYLNSSFSGDAITSIAKTTLTDVTVYAKWEKTDEPVIGDTFNITYNLNGGAWSWTAGTVSAPASGIDSVSNLPEVFMADFYTYLFENGLLSSSKVAEKLRVSNWAGFSAKYGDPVAWYNATSTGGYSAADGYSELFFDSVNGYEAVGGFLGTSPYKEKYANVTKHAIQLTVARYDIATTSNSFKGALGFVLDGYFYGTQGLLASSKPNYETFNSLRGTIPTPTVGYEGSTSSTNAYEILSGVVGTPVELVAPVREGHMFLGWYGNADGTGEKITSVSSGCTLYAKWYDLNAPAPVYSIDYELNGGENSSDAPYEFTFGEGVVLTEPSRSGYTFVGWSTDANGEDLITEISPLQNTSIKVYANWVEGEELIYSIEYIYTDGKLPTRTPSSVDEVIEYVLTSYYNWLKPTEAYETFKTKVTTDWTTNQNQNTYKFYKQGGKDVIDENYFVNASENYEEWSAWFTVFDAQVTAANGAQNAWNSYVGILRLGQWLSNKPPVTWKDSMNQALIDGTHIKIPLVTEYELGDEFTLTELVIDDGRTFLGWYDENGNKVEKISSNTEGDLVLTAKWSEAVPVESFAIDNLVEGLLKLSTHQLTWTINPSNATFKKVTFESSNPDVLTVSEDGLLTAVSVGTATISVTVHGNTSLNTEFDVEVYVDPYIDGEFADTSYVVAGQSIDLGATLVGEYEDKLVWKSNTANIASVSSSGSVKGLSEGLAEIVVYCENKEDISFTFYVTVLESEPTGILKLLLDSHNSSIYTEKDLLIGIKIGSDGAYYSDIYGSVSKLLFEEYEVHDDYYLSNPNNKSTLSSGGIQFITVHYAADMPYAPSATFNGGKNLASYNKSCNTNGTQASWHYSVGNDGIWACQNEAYGAWHAGSSKTMTWTDSGLTTAVLGEDIYPTDVTLGSDGYFYIKGVKTTVKNTSAGSKLNGMGLAVKTEGNKVYLGGHYYNSSYGYISSTGGNNNSIGMETSVREGSDLWLTWQYTAQLCAKLLLKYDLPLNRLVGHHFFSGKWCPQPMLEHDLEIWHEFVELTRQQMELYDNYSNYKLSFASSSELLKDNGRVANLPDYPECVTYTVTYTDGTTTKNITLSSIIPGELE